MYIYDIGGNVGKFTEVALSLYPNAHVVIVEANDGLISHLSSKFSGKNVTIINKAMSNIENVEIDFYLSNADTISTASTEWITNSRFTGTYNWNRVLKKKTITLDKLLEAYPEPDIIKIDVEGYELEVIKGLTTKQKKLCFEWAEEQSKNIIATCDYLENLGYLEFGFIEADEYLQEPSEWLDKTSCIRKMNMVPERKLKWGMIWVK